MRWGEGKERPSQVALDNVGDEEDEILPPGGPLSLSLSYNALPVAIYKQRLLKLFYNALSVAIL